MDKKIKKYLCVDDIEELKAISWNKMRIVTPKIADKRIIAYRFKHMERVADISYQIMMKYMEEYKKSGKSYSSKKTKITKSDYHQLKEIEKNNIETTVIFLGLVHDIYKFCESDNLGHGELVASFFKDYCKRNGIKNTGIVKKMYEALRDHSDKNKNNDNLFYKILVEADVLSKYSEENFKEKISLFNASASEEFKKLEGERLKDYKPKTPFFNDLKFKYKNELICLMERGVFREFDRKGGDKKWDMLQ